MTDHSTPCDGLRSTNEKFEYFMERTEKDLDYIRGKVDQLWAFRLMIIGGSMVLSTFMTLVMNYIMRLK